MTSAPTPVPHGPAEHRGPPWLIAVIFTTFAVGSLTVILLAWSGAFQGAVAVHSAQGSGVAATQTRDVPPFSAVTLAGSNNVVIRIGGRQSVAVGGDIDVLDHITTRVVEDRLVIGTTGNVTSQTPMRVDITVPSLQDLSLDGSGVMVVHGIHTADLTVTLSGSGLIFAGGSVTRLDVTLSGAGDVRLGGLVAQHARAALDGSGRIALTATTSLDASLPGTGTILYGGNPADVTKNVTGEGTITSR